MKCKQCGWKNPDNYDRCEKCNHVLTKPRIDEMQASGYEAQRMIVDSTSVGYMGACPGSEYQRPYNGQPYSGQPIGQPYNGQPYDSRQPYNNNIQPTYPGAQPSQPQQPFNPANGRLQYDSSPQQNQYGPMPDMQYAPQPETLSEERYCPECDAELPDGATECPVCHTKIEAETIVVVEGVCPDCGAEVTPVQKFCHNCGAPLKVRENKGADVQQLMPQPEQPRQDVSEARDNESPIAEPGITASNVEEEGDDTVAAGPLSLQIPECELRMTGASGENLRTVSCAGDQVELYRDNIDPANNTIARDIQARLTFADGKWCIEDCSALQTTFIRPARKMELQDGDIIVMGNREFIFKS